MMAIIKQMKEKIKSFLKKIVDFLGKDIVFFSLLIILASSISFFLGSLSEFNKQKEEKINSIELLKEKNQKEIYFVASKNGKRYYLPWCYSGSEKNKIKFKTKEEAEKAGYTPSKNCEGL
jgi:hypothetical protein